ncbi:MAG: hypothetical protein BZ138_08105 [Methanosphaera sp. rholeuAM270]|nr:MAG: hypothetical protein BZ138_08105 [Methanosphaera sp. rholeuAM270]
MPTKRELHKIKLDLNFPSFVSVAVQHENKPVGEFWLSFNCLNDLTHVEFKPNGEIDAGLDNKLSLYSIHIVLSFNNYIFLADNSTLSEMVNALDEEFGDDITLKLKD